MNLEIYHCVNLQICNQGENPTNHATVLSILKRKEGEKVEMMIINVDNDDDDNNNDKKDGDWRS